MKCNNKNTRTFLIVYSVISFIYGLVLPFCYGNNPLSPTGTLSLMCEDRKFLFVLWAILVVGGIVLNIQYMYKKFGIRNTFLNFLNILSLVSMAGVTITLKHPIDSWNPKRIVHWITTGLYIVGVFAAIALFFLIYRNIYKSFIFLFICVVAILLTFILIFAVVGKSALMEMIPIAMLQIFLFVINFTPLIKTKQSEQ